MQKTDVHAN